MLTFYPAWHSVDKNWVAEGSGEWVMVVNKVRKGGHCQRQRDRKKINFDKGLKFLLSKGGNAVTFWFCKLGFKML